MTQVRCTVDNCHYWAEGGGCRASSILITSDAAGATQPHGIDAPVAGTLEPTPTQTCMETCCKTFHRRGASKRHADDVSMEG